MAICQIDGCTEHYACRMRAKGLRVSPRAETTKTQNWRPTPSVPPSHWKNVVHEDRPGGYKIPVWKPDGTVLRTKEYGENQTKIDAILKSKHQHS